jgi:hypothetical protein
MMFLDHFVRGPRAPLVLALVIAAGPARADPGLRIGTHGGVELRDGADPYLGVDLRVSFSRSPLTINPTFDRVFDAKATLYRLGVTALYYLPVPIRGIDPYVGVGVNVTSFSLTEAAADVDDNGNRVGLSLAAGACFDLAFVSPFVQVGKQLGELAPISLAAGLVVALDHDDRWSGCGRRAR